MKSNDTLREEIIALDAKHRERAERLAALLPMLPHGLVSIALKLLDERKYLHKIVEAAEQVEEVEQGNTAVVALWEALDKYRVQYPKPK